MRAIYVPLTEDLARKLGVVAERERRGPREQAEVLLAEAVERALRKAGRREVSAAATRATR